MAYSKPYNLLNSKSLALMEDFRGLLSKIPKNKVIAEYVWIGGSGLDIRNKTRIIENS